jgi:hypothetical protein
MLLEYWSIKDKLIKSHNISKIGPDDINQQEQAFLSAKLKSIVAS